jgi:hypothetical protein
MPFSPTVKRSCTLRHLQDEHIGDASIEGKLKKLVGRARELQAAELQAAEKTAQ